MLQCDAWILNKARAIREVITKEGWDDLFLNASESCLPEFMCIKDSEDWILAQYKNTSNNAQEVLKLCNQLCLIPETWLSRTNLIHLEAGLTRFINLRSNELAIKAGCAKYDAKISILSDTVLQWPIE